MTSTAKIHPYFQSAKAAVARRLRERFPTQWLRFRWSLRKHQFEPEYWLVPLFCAKDRTAIDVGANVGEYSFLMARYARQVVSFEPNADLHADLRRLLGARARIEAAALSSAAGTASLRLVASNTGVATIEKKNRLTMLDGTETIEARPVALRTVDSFGFQDVSFIKIDVEGHEEAVVEGARETLRRCRPVLLIESENRHNPGAPRRLAALLTSLGYDAFFIKWGRLCQFEELEETDVDAANLTRPDCCYIYNYLFIPTGRADLVARVRSELGSANRTVG